MGAVLESPHHGLAPKRTETGRRAEERGVNIVAGRTAVDDVGLLVHQVIPRSSHDHHSFLHVRLAQQETAGRGARCDVRPADVVVKARGQQVAGGAGVLVLGDGGLIGHRRSGIDFDGPAPAIPHADGAARHGVVGPLVHQHDAVSVGVVLYDARAAQTEQNRRIVSECVDVEIVGPSQQSKILGGQGKGDALG